MVSRSLAASVRITSSALLAASRAVPPLMVVVLLAPPLPLRRMPFVVSVAPPARVKAWALLAVFTMLMAAKAAVPCAVIAPVVWA